MTPESNLIILKGVPFSSTYQDLLTFSNESAQQSYFMGLAKFPAFSDFTYLRNQEGYPIRVEINAEQLQDCDYIMFQNSAYGNKWFYAFITDVQYRADETSFIYFSLDIWQTWQFNFDVKQCFVEREHVNDDTIGKNILPEPVPGSDYYTRAENNFLVTDLNVYVLLTETTAGLSTIGPGTISGWPQPCYIYPVGTIDNFSAATVKNIIDELTAIKGPDVVIGIMTMPANMCNPDSANAWSVKKNAVAPALPFTPKNNKLYTSPYCVLSVESQGSALELKFENFAIPTAPQLQFYSAFGQNGAVICWPVNYEGQADGVQYQCVLKDFPPLSWQTNSFSEWIARTKSTLLPTLVTAGIGATTLAAGGAVALSTLAASSAGKAALASTAVNLPQMVGQGLAAASMPDKNNGGVLSAAPMAINKKLGFYVRCRSYKTEILQLIDNYLSAYGYQVDAIKTPNIIGRQNWNYVKTNNSIVMGDVPAKVCREFEGILNRGVTFWHTTDIGNYSLPNAIVGGV